MSSYNYTWMNIWRFRFIENSLIQNTKDKNQRLRLPVVSQRILDVSNSTAFHHTSEPFPRPPLHWVEWVVTPKLPNKIQSINLTWRILHKNLYLRVTNDVEAPYRHKRTKGSHKKMFRITDSVRNRGGGSMTKPILFWNINLGTNSRGMGG